MIQEQLTMAIAVGMMITMMAMGYVAGRLTRIEKLCVKEKQKDNPFTGNPIVDEMIINNMAREMFPLPDPIPLPKKIKIDDSKFVGEISTDSIEKKYGELGETKVSDENISSSVNKLKGMKK